MAKVLMYPIIGENACGFRTRMLMIFMTTLPPWLCATILAVDGVEIQRVPDQRQNELLAEFERRKKVGH